MKKTTKNKVSVCCQIDPIKEFIGKCRPKGKVDGVKEIKNYYKKIVNERN